MRRKHAIGFLTALCFVTVFTTASAQIWPGHFYGYGRVNSDDALAWGALSGTALDYAAGQRVAQSDRLASQLAGARQLATVRSSGQSMLESQAQDIIGQKQQNRDWWFQVQQQQAAERQALAARPSMAMTRTAMFESPAIETPPAATDIIKWLPVLCDPRFAAERAIIEAPYRRNPKERASPTAADYQNMIDATVRMKLILGQMTGEISAQEYLDAVKFLDQLAVEARGRLENRSALPSRHAGTGWLADAN